MRRKNHRTIRIMLAGVLILGLLGSAPSFASERSDGEIVLERILEIGMIGEDVQAVQERLIEMEFLNPPADGYFGPMTREAVNLFQQENGLAVPDGQVGPWTLAVLNASIPRQNTITEPEAAGQEDDLAPADSGIVLYRTLGIGMYGEDVQAVQERLIEMEYLNPPADGYFGPMTLDAVNALQAANGMDVPDGLVGNWTVSLLNDSSENVDAEITAQDPLDNVLISVPLTLDRTLDYGSLGEDVLAVQEYLIYLGYMNGGADGDFGIVTLAAVKAFQYDNGLLYPDGSIGSWTMNQLNRKMQEAISQADFANEYEEENTISFNEDPDGTIPLTRELHMGMYGKDVYALQEKLYELGYLSVLPDGSFGPMTRQAVQTFQMNQGMTIPDGVVGSQTFQLLTGSNMDTSLSGSQITWIGDSLTALAGQYTFDRLFPGADYGGSFNNADSYVCIGKGIVNHVSDGANPNGLTILSRLAQTGELRKYLVFALGTNDPWGTEEIPDYGYLDTIRSLAGEDTVIILTTSVTRNTDFSVSNQLLRHAAKKYSNVYLADWAAVFQEEYFLADGVHYTDEGHMAFLQTIKDTLEEAAIAENLR